VVGLSEGQLRDVLMRQQLYDQVVEGEVEQVMEQVSLHYSSTFWEDHKSLSFKLRVQQFLEAMRGGSSSAAAALDYGRTHLVPALSCAADEELLADVLSTAGL